MDGLLAWRTGAGFPVGARPVLVASAASFWKTSLVEENGRLRQKGGPAGKPTLRMAQLAFGVYKVTP